MQSNDHENLSAYLDGELTDAEVAELEAELARDPILREELSELEDVVQWMRRDGPEQAPFGFHRRVMDRIEAEHPTANAAWWRRPFGLPLEGWLVVAAAAAVLLLALPRGAPDVKPWETRPAQLQEPETDVAPPEDGGADPTEQVRLSQRPEGDVPRKGIRPSVHPGDLPPIGIPPEEMSPPTADEAGPGPEDTSAPPKVAYPPGFAYTMRSGDPAMKRRVLAVASRYGVPMTLTGSEASSTFDANRDTVVVDVPTGKLAQLNTELERLGYDTRGMADGELVRGRTLLVRIHLELSSSDE